MKITEDMVKDFINDGAASAIDSAKRAAGKIAAQINAELETNSSHSSSNTIEMRILVKLDADSRKVEIEGSFGFKTPNIGDKAPKIVREIPDPDQMQLLDSDGNPAKETAE